MKYMLANKIIMFYLTIRLINIPSIMPCCESYHGNKSSPDSCAEEVERKDVSQGELEWKERREGGGGRGERQRERERETERCYHLGSY